MSTPKDKASTSRTTAKKATTKRSPMKKATAAASRTEAASAKTTGAKRGATKSAADVRTPRKQPAPKAASPKRRTPKDGALAVQSKYFKGALERAKGIAGDPDKLRKIADQASGSGALRSGPFTAVLDDFRALIRLVVAYARGHYREIPTDALVTVIGGLIYVVSPIDLIPDTIPGVGYLDDVTVIGWVIKTVRGELDAFQEWEAGQRD
ncbi:hypothetical protein ASG78_09465 [Nostocoides sp. Soil756]|nr:hypothetical protein ASG78_09465 [Tetrasphaera sp. Soil756]